MGSHVIVKKITLQPYKLMFSSFLSVINHNLTPISFQLHSAKIYIHVAQQVNDSMQMLLLLGSQRHVLIRITALALDNKKYNESETIIRSIPLYNTVSY